MGRKFTPRVHSCATLWIAMVTGHWQKRKAITLNICEVLFAGLYLLYVWTRKGARNPGVNVLHFGFEKPACCKAWLSSEKIITTKCTTRRNVCAFSNAHKKCLFFYMQQSYINMTGDFVSYYKQFKSMALCPHIVWKWKPCFLYKKFGFLLKR